MISSRHYALCLFLILTGCTTSQPPPAQPATDAEDLFARPVVADSVLRDASRLQLALALPEGGTALVAVDCTKDEGELLYLDGAQRVYPGRVNGYAAPLSLSPPKVAALKHNPQVQALCAQPFSSDWRALASAPGGDTLVLDRNSLIDVDGVRRFWGGQQLGAAVQTPRYGAPVRQWRESLAADCTARRYTLAARYGLDASGRIVDGQLATPTQEAFASAPLERRTLLEAACDRRDALLAAPRMQALTAEAPPAKAPAPLAELPAARPQPLQAIQSLGLPAARVPLQRFVEEGESRYEGQSHPYRQEVQVSPGSAPGLLRLTAQGKMARVDALSWRGLFDLVRRTRVDNGSLPVEELATLDQLTFSGNWRALTVGSQVGYQARQTLTGTLKDTEQRDIKVTCKVVGESEARRILASLNGRAKTLECRHGEAANAPASRWVYLEDYGFFHLIRMGAGGAMGLEKHLSLVQ
ncbi:lipoprotein [Pseudomonas oryzihabitans]|nr:lipoprotein [Pseudomonas psychrotolerans]